MNKLSKIFAGILNECFRFLQKRLVYLESKKNIEGNNDRIGGYLIS